MDITDKSLNEFRKDFANAVSSLQDKYGVTIALGPITYEDERFSARLTVTNGREKYEVESRQFDANVWKFEYLGLTQGMYNRMFVGKDGMKYAIQGFNTRAKKYPLEIVRFSDGEKSRAGEGFIMQLLDEYYVEVTVT